MMLTGRFSVLRSAVLLSWLASLTLGCEIVPGSGEIVSETRPIPEVAAVSVCCGFEVDLKIGDVPRLVVTADDNLIDKIEVDVNDGLLEIGWGEESSFFDPTEPVHLELTLPELVHFEGSGGVRLWAEDLASERLSIELSGGSQARMSQVFVNELHVEENGGSQISFELISSQKTVIDSSGGSILEAAGLSLKLDASISGGGKLKAEDLITDYTHLDLSGGSHAELTVMQTLKGEASGGSVMVVHGDPARDVDSSGGSEVHDH